LRNNELINGISAIEHVIRAYRELVSDVADTSAFESATEQVLCTILNENSTLTSNNFVGNADGQNLRNIGCCRIPIAASSKLSNVLTRSIPHLFDGREITLPVRVNYSKPLTAIFSTDRQSQNICTLSEYFLFASLSEKASMNFRCADLVSGGSFFKSALSLIPQFTSRSGGRVYSKQEDFAELLRELEKAANNAMSKLGGSYATVCEYNEKNQDKLPEYIIVIHLGNTDFFRNELSRLKVLLQNSQRNGMSFVIVCDSGLFELFKDVSGIQLKEENGNLFLGSAAKLPLTLEIQEQEIAQMLAQISTSMQESEKVDTLYENHPELHTGYFSMDSAAALRIPFAIDKFNRLQYFEIGGNAPSHALIAGSTGSGKSSVLHTLIMQTMHHYHPDDVEIWAIDYKAVEFNFYIQNPTPHFRVIAHDTATEFSLSLIDLLYKEYEERQRKFLESKVKDIEAYRRKHGKHAMPRILVVIDEFQLMTQAVMEYNGYKDYRTELENLLRLTRAMGISFVFSSQTIASGLQGLSDAARDQIGCRLCLKHEDTNEIWETLTLSGPDANEIVYRAKELRRGRGIYKRTRWANEHSPDGRGFEYLQSHILFLNEDIRGAMIGEINAAVGNQYTPKETITVRGGGRISVEEKVRHPIQKFMTTGYEPADECLEWYPAAPASLADYFRVDIEPAAGVNILMVGELDELRDSVVTHSVCGFLMNPQTKVIANFIDEQNPDRKRLIDTLRKIRSPRFEIRTGVDAVMETIRSLQRIRPTYGSNTVYLWYGLDKLKNEIFLAEQEDRADSPVDYSSPPLPTPEKLVFELPDDTDFDDAFFDNISNALENNDSTFGQTSTKAPIAKKSEEKLSYDQCISILKTAYDAGPENGKLHIVIFNNLKSMKRCKLIQLESFENILATKISLDDSHDLFKTGLAVKNITDDTVVFSSGGSRLTYLRPYLMPKDSWFRDFNKAITMQ